MEFNIKEENNVGEELKFKLREEYNVYGENEVNISFESINQILNINNPKLSIEVYGFDNTYSDGEATLITRQHFEISKLPNSLILKIPKDSFELIKSNKTKETSLFYIGVDWDSNNNEKIDTGDISLDFDKGFPILDLETKNIQTFFMKVN